MEVYLNDHLAGAMLGSDLAEQILERSEGTPFGDVMLSSPRRSTRTATRSST